MASTTVVLFVALGMMLIIMMVAQGLSRTVDILSIRNIYLAGFIIYQIASPASTLWSGNFSGYRVYDPDRAGNWMLLYAYLYIGIFLLSYHRINVANRFADKLNRHVSSSANASDSMLTGVAVSVILVALAIRLVGSQIPVLRGISINVSIALAAVACATAGWIWGKQRLNPAVLLVVGLVLSISMFVSLSGFFSRRPLISVLAGFAWGAYHRWARLLAPSRLLLSTLPILIAGVVVVSAFTAIRSHKTGETAAQETLQQMRGANVATGATDLVGGQTSGAATMWILENYPQYVPYNPLFSFQYMAYWYVPRFLWEDKPLPLGNHLATIARLEGVNRKIITLPPGVLGFAGAEGGFYAVILYALFFGQFTKLFDQMVKLNPTNPFVLLPIGCTTGQFLGLARGDLALFTNIALLGTVTAFILLHVASLAFGRSRSASLQGS